MFLNPALAQTATGAAAGGGIDFMFFVPLLGIFAVFYFLVIRPQSQKAKQHQARLAALKRGDRVLTSGGIIGTVSRLVSDTEVDVKIAENVTVRVRRATLADTLAKGEPVRAEQAKGSGKHAAASDKDASDKDASDKDASDKDGETSGDDSQKTGPA